MPANVSEAAKWLLGVIATPILDGAFWLFDKWNAWELEQWRKQDGL